MSEIEDMVKEIERAARLLESIGNLSGPAQNLLINLNNTLALYRGEDPGKNEKLKQPDK